MTQDTHPDPDRVAELLDKQDITEVIYRYFRGVDRVDRELVRDCFFDDATDEHGSFSGGIDDLIDWIFKLLNKYDATFHFAGNVLIEVDGDAAHAETYGMSHHRQAGGDEQNNLITAFRFVDRFERRNGEWRIAKRTSITEWSRIDREQDWWAFPDHFRTGLRDRTDPAYWGVGSRQ